MGMHRSRSDATLRTRKDPCQDGMFERTTRAVPGYMGYVPGRKDNFDFSTWRRETQACHEQRKLPTFDAQMLRMAPHDSNEAKSEVDERYGRVIRNIPGYTGYIPGKFSENIHAEGFSSTCSNSLSSHFMARKAPRERESQILSVTLKARPFSAPKRSRSSSRPRDVQRPISAPELSSRKKTSQRPQSAPLITKDHTAVSLKESDLFPEIPLHNRSYQDMVRGWSDCIYNGCQIDPAGAVAPHGRQERFCRGKPPVGDGIPPNYDGYVPGKVSENVIGERRPIVRQISKLLNHKNTFRTQQR